LSYRWSIVVTVLALASALRAEARPRAGRIEGTITAVNPAAVPPTVAITGGTATVVLNITSATRVQKAGDDHATAADLRVGLSADAEYDPAAADALRIQIQPGANELSTRGALVNATYDSGSNTGLVDIDTNGDGVRDLVLRTGAQTLIRAGSVALPQADLGILIDLRVRAEYDATTFAAFELNAEGVDGAEVEIAGVVTATVVDPGGGGTLLLQLATGASIVFQVVPGTEIRLNGKRVPLAVVEVAESVEVRYLASGTGPSATLVALQMTLKPVKPSHVEGTLIGVWVAGFAQVQPRNGGPPVMLTVGGDTDLRLNGRRVTLAELGTVQYNATIASREVKVSAQYLAHGGANVATRLGANLPPKHGGH